MPNWMVDATSAISTATARPTSCGATARPAHRDLAHERIRSVELARSILTERQLDRRRTSATSTATASPTSCGATTSTGQTAVWLMNGTMPTSQAPCSCSDPDWTVTPIGDFNGDGRSDLVWRNSVDGANRDLAHERNRATSSIAVVMLSNVDRHRDRRLQRRRQGRPRSGATPTGATAVWLMNGTAPISSAIVLDDPSWSIAQTGDFNVDGRTDLLFRNNVNNQAAIWLMDEPRRCRLPWCGPMPAGR